MSACRGKNTGRLRRWVLWVLCGECACNGYSSQCKRPASSVKYTQEKAWRLADEQFLLTKGITGELGFRVYRIRARSTWKIRLSYCVDLLLLGEATDS